MQSNSYMTQRIPANWDDPELDEMSEAYISSGKPIYYELLAIENL